MTIILRDVRGTLLNTKSFLDNEYLTMYSRLIDRNYRTPQRGNTNRHHIIPRSWFKLNNQEVDNSMSNLVNLLYRDHVLAHYYLCLCTEGPLKYANELALIMLSGKHDLSSVDKQLVLNLPLYNNIYEDYSEKRKTHYELYKDKIEE